MRTNVPTTPQQSLRRFFACSIVGFALLLAACGSSESESQDSSSADAAAQEQELQERADELERREEEAAARERKARERERKARQAEREARRKKRSEAAEPPSAPTSGGSGGGGITVPNVVGLDHQAAQDALQGEGLYNLDERDCTGQGRVLLFDRNWEVVSTDPAAGTPVSEDTKITLCSVKQGER